MALPYVNDVTVSPRDLRADVVPRTMPTTALWRRNYGRGIDLSAIQNAISSAEVGLMADLTDLSTESSQTDPHLSSQMLKRIGAVATAPWNLDPARGPDTDKALALEAQTVMHSVVRKIPSFTERIFDLGWALFDGRAAQEIHWASVLPIGKPPFQIRWLPVDLRWLHPRTLSFGPERELRVIDPTRDRGYFQNTDGFALDDYPGKFLQWMPRLFRELPEREGLAPRCLYWSFFKRFSWRYRMILTELFGIPWRIVK
jgi:phage gp29-like protein